MTVPMWVWGATVLAVLLLIAFDFFTVSRTPHEVGIGEAARWSIFYVALAVVFGIGVYYFMGSQSGTEFFTAYLVEKSLSVDNLFVFAIILAQFAVPSILQQRVLLIGIVLALIFRGRARIENRGDVDRTAATGRRPAGLDRGHVARAPPRPSSSGRRSDAAAPAASRRASDAPARAGGGRGERS